MSDEWTQISGNRVRKKISHDIILVKPYEDLKMTPLSCPLCGFLFCGMEDISTYNFYKVCNECTLQWAQPHYAEWKNGWRPSTDEMKKYIDNRMRMPTYLIK